MDFGELCVVFFVVSGDEFDLEFCVEFDFDWGYCCVFVEWEVDCVYEFECCCVFGKEGLYQFFECLFIFGDQWFGCLEFLRVILCQCDELFEVWLF